MGHQYPGDLINYYYPMNEHVTSRLADGELPLWNPLACGGIPLLATLQSRIFYPGTWLSLWLPVDQALSLVMFLECLIGGWFSFLFFRTLLVSDLAASLGGVLFIFACMLGETFWPPVVSTVIWLPWLLLCVEKLVGDWKWRWWLALVIGTAIQIIAGFPQYLVYTFYLVVPYAAMRIIEEHRRQARDRASSIGTALGLMLGIALAVGLSGLQILPTLELVQNSLRNESLSADAVHYLGGLTSAGVFRNSINPEPKLISFDFGMGSGYLGIPTLFLLLVGIIAGARNFRVWLFLAVALVSLLLSDGYRAIFEGLYQFYSTLPTGSMFRTPERLRFLFFFCLVTVAVVGFDQFARGFTGLRSLTARRAALIGSILLFIIIAVFGSIAAVWRAVATLGIFFIATRMSSSAWARRTTILLLLALLTFDLAHATGPYGSLRRFPAGLTQVFHTLGYTLLDGPAFEKIRDQADLDRIAFVGEPAQNIFVLPFIGAQPVDGAYRLSCYEPLLPAQWPTLFKELGGDASSGAVMANLDAEVTPSLYDVASVKLIAKFQRAGPDFSLEELIEENERAGRIYSLSSKPLPASPPKIQMELVQNEDVLPRAYLVDRTQVQGQEDILQHIANSDLDFHRMVLLDRDPGLKATHHQFNRIRPVEITSYHPEQVELRLETPHESLLVLTDSFYPGWRAWVGGVEAEIFRANGLFRAIRVPAGQHRVVFEYRPRSLRWGMGISVASLGLLIAIPLSSLLASRRVTKLSSDSPSVD
jgi:hypothetical protein